MSLTGISSDISQVYGSMVDAYVLHQDLENIIFLYNLVPASADSANVILRECDEPPHILPPCMAVDLLDLGIREVPLRQNAFFKILFSGRPLSYDRIPILIPAIGAERSSWLGLADISEIMPQGWSLAGGSMMRLLASERSYAGSRSTHDIDVILDIRASRAHIHQFHEALSNAGFSIAGFNASGQNHRWVRVKLR